MCWSMQKEMCEYKSICILSIIWFQNDTYLTPPKLDFFRCPARLSCQHPSFQPVQGGRTLIGTNDFPHALGNPKMKTYTLRSCDIPIMCCLIISSFSSWLTPYGWGPGQLWSVAITRTFYAHQWKCWLRSSAVSAASAAAFKTLAVNFSSTVIHRRAHDRCVKRFTTAP